MSYFDEISAALAELTSADPEEIRQVLRQYDVRDVQAVTINEGGGGNGGSQPGAANIYGPYTLTAADFPGVEGDARGVTVDLVTLPVGAVVYGWQVDPETLEQWDTGGDVWIGQGTDWTPDNSILQKGTWGEVGFGGGDLDNALIDSYTEATAGDHKMADGALRLIALNVIAEATPIQAMWWDFTEASEPTTGRTDLYFLIALAPTAPSDLT